MNTIRKMAKDHQLPNVLRYSRCSAYRQIQTEPPTHDPCSVEQHIPSLNWTLLHDEWVWNMRHYATLQPSKMAWNWEYVIERLYKNIPERFVLVPWCRIPGCVDQLHIERHWRTPNSSLSLATTIKLQHWCVQYQIVRRRNELPCSILLNRSAYAVTVRHGQTLGWILTYVCSKATSVLKKEDLLRKAWGNV